MTEFNIGDKVIDPDGDEGIIADEANGNYKVVFGPSEMWWWEADDLKLVVEENTDAINPSHYKFGKSEVIDIVEHLPYNRGNAIKYLARAGRKEIADELEDLKKALWYVEREIKRVTELDSQ